MQNKQQATNQAVRNTNQAQMLLTQASLAGNAQLSGVLQISLASNQASLRKAIDDEAQAQGPGDAGRQAVLKRLNADPGSAFAVAQATRPAQANANATGPQATPANAPAAPAAPKPEPNSPEELKTYDSLKQATPEQVQATSDAAKQLKEAKTDEDKLKAYTKLHENLNPAEVDKLSTAMGVDKDPVIQAVRQDSKARDAMKALAKPDSTPEQRADAALKLAGRLQELNVVQGKAGEVIKEWLGSVPSAEQVVKDLNTLSDPNASKTDKVASALSLSDSLGKLLPGKLEESLKPLLSSLAGGSELAKSIAKWADPEASAQDKAKAALDLAKSIKSTVGDFSPDLARKLRSLDSSLNSVGNAMTLLDPNASLKDKAEAALGLAADVPQIAGDLKALKSWLKERGVDNASGIVDEAARLPASARLPQAVRAGLSDEAAGKLTPEQADQMAKTYADNKNQLREKAMAISDPAERTKALNKVEAEARAYGASTAKAISGLSDPKAVDALVKELAASPDAAARRALADAVGGMKPGMADHLLTSQFGDKSGAQVLAKAAQNVDAGDAKKLATLMGDLGSKEAVKAFGETLSRTSAAGLPQLVNTLHGMKPGVADKLLTSQIDGKPAAEVLSGVMDKLDKDSADKLGKILASGDEKAAKFALQLASSADASVLKETLKLIGDPEMAGKALQAFSSVLDKAGIKMNRPGNGGGYVVKVIASTEARFIA